MPKTKLQEVIFTILIVIVMVYAMVCYNIAFAMGGMQNMVFIAALSEMSIMCGIGFILDMLIAGPLAKKCTLKIVDPQKTDLLLQYYQFQYFQFYLCVL